MSTEVTGYDPDIRFYATRYRQGGRTVFSIDLSLTQIAGLLPKPDPARVTEGNRRIKQAHARAFGDYVRTQPDWIAPALVLRSPDIFKFDVRENIGGTEFGILSFPRLASTDLRILDGQHRILGIHVAIQGIADDLEKARSSLAAARRNGALPPLIAQYENGVRRLNEQRKRFDRERTTLQIFIEDDQTAYKQMFFDIADNALGITSSVRARFDSRKVVNRSLEDVMKHELLKDRVDLEQDAMRRSNPNLMGAKHVAEIVRTLAVGLKGRISRRLEDELREDALVERTNAFLDVLLDSFPPFEAIVAGELTPDELRRTSLLGSTVTHRVLAAVYKDLVDEHEFEDGDVTEFFAALAPHMHGPVAADSIWITKVGEDIFSVGAFSPRSRYKDLDTLHTTMLDWALAGPDSLAGTARTVEPRESGLTSSPYTYSTTGGPAGTRYPGYQTRRMLVLEALNDGQDLTPEEIRRRVAVYASLTDEDRAQLTARGRQNKFINDVAHVLARPKGMFETVYPGTYRITDRGRSALAETPRVPHTNGQSRRAPGVGPDTHLGGSGAGEAPTTRIAACPECGRKNRILVGRRNRCGACGTEF